MPTVLSNVILSKRAIQGGVRGRQIRKNDRVSVDNGREYVNQVWTQTRREFEIGFKPMLRRAWMDIEAVYEVTEAGALGFLMLDPKDHTVGAGEGVVAGLTSTTFQLYKRITEPVSARYKDRKITRPVAGEFALYISGVLQSSGYTLDADTGIVTIAAAPSAAAVTWVGNFYVPVHFQSDALDWSMLRPGSNADSRLLAGPTCVLQEIRE